AGRSPRRCRPAAWSSFRMWYGYLTWLQCSSVWLFAPVSLVLPCCRASAISFSTCDLLLLSSLGFVFSNFSQAVIAPAASLCPCQRISPRLKRELASVG